MHARGAPDHHPSSSRAGYAPLNAPHAPLPDEGAAERIAQRVCTPRGVMIAALCAGAFYFGPPRGVGARRAWMEETPASQWRARRRRPRSGDGRAGTRREPRACPRASSIVTPRRASTTTTTRRGPRWRDESTGRESVIGGGRRRRRRTTFRIRPDGETARGPGATFRGARDAPDAARVTTRTGADPFPRRGFDSRRGRRRPGEAGGRRETRIGSTERRRHSWRHGAPTQLAGGSTSSSGVSAPPCSNVSERVIGSSLDCLILVAPREYRRHLVRWPRRRARDAL